MDRVRIPGTLLTQQIEAHGADILAPYRQGHGYARPDTERPIVLPVHGVRDFVNAREADHLSGAEGLESPGESRLGGNRRRRRGKTRTYPTHEIDRQTIRLNPAEGAPIEIERLANPAQRIANRIVDPVCRHVDELRRRFGDEPLELELFLDRHAGRPGGLFAGRDIHHRREHERTAGCFDGIQADFNGKLRAVAAAAAGLGACAHLRCSRQSLRKHGLDRLPEQLVARVSALSLDFGVDEHDRALAGHDENPARKRFGCLSEQAVSVETRLTLRRCDGSAQMGPSLERLCGLVYHPGRPGHIGPWSHVPDFLRYPGACPE